MKKEIFVRWNNGERWESEGSKGGTFRLSLDNNDRFCYEITSGSAIDAEEFIGFLWFHPSLQEWRDLAKNLKRKREWKIKSLTGHSGATNWWIQYMCPYQVPKSTQTCFHVSMYGKANEPIENVWIKDLYDLLWAFSKKGIFENAFKDVVDDDGTVNSSYGFADITDEVERKRKEFKEDSFDSDVGFGKEDLTSSTTEDEEIVDYSNYTPTESEAEDSDDLYQELRDRIAIDEDDEYI